MACYHPLKAFPIGLTNTGKTQYKICSYEVHHVELTFGDKWIATKSEIKAPSSKRVVTEFIEIPCGQCTACRLEYSRQWANRCMLELQSHDSAYFVTLTYDDAHLPHSSYVDEETGEVLPSFTLVKRDFQLFMKRLRKRFPDDNIRFFACGEYGDKTFRPHYHAIIFGLHLDDLVFYKHLDRGYNYYNSKSLQDCWSVRENGELVPIGFAVVANVTWETCAYTARYVMKKLKGKEAEFYERFAIYPEFTLMSRRPGIGRGFFDGHPGIFETSFITVGTEKGGLKFKPPRYYDKLFDLQYPDEMKEIKEQRRRLANEVVRSKLENTTNSYLELLAVEERNQKAKIKSLRREL